MDKILINPADIESCWEKPDACMVKMKTGKVWVCEKETYRQTGLSGQNACIVLNTLEKIKANQQEKFVELPLKGSGKYGK